LLYWGVRNITGVERAMKSALVYIASVAFLLPALAFAADKPATDRTKVDPAKTNVVKSANDDCNRKSHQNIG